MQNAKDEDGILADGVTDYVRRPAYDEFACAFDPSDTARMRVKRQPLHLALDLVPDGEGGSRVSAAM